MSSSGARKKRRSVGPPTFRPGQPGGKRDLNRQRKEKALKDAAMQLFLERGIEGVSIDDITQRAGVAKGSFYRYFRDKTALVESLMAPARAEMEAALEECSRMLGEAADRESMFRAYRVVGSAVITLVLEHPEVARLYLQESRGPGVGARAPVRALSELVSRYAIEITEKAHAHRVFRPIHPAVSALAVVGASERLLQAVLAEEDVGNPLEIPEALTTIVLDGLRARA